MESKAIIEFGDLDKDDFHRISIALLPLETAELVAHRYGFYDLDVDSTDSGGVKIKASARNRSLSVTGRNAEEAVEKLLQRLVGSEYVV